MEGDFRSEFYPVICKAANLSEIKSGSAEGTSVSFIVGTVKMSIPLEGLINADEEKSKILAELEHQRGFLASVQKKLSNQNFVAHAPENVVAVERKKEADALARIAALEASLNSLNNN